MNLQFWKRIILHAASNKPRPCSNPCSSSVFLFYSTSKAQPKTEKVQIFDVLRKYDIAPETATLSKLKKPEKCDSVLSFLKENGFSTSQLVRLLNSKPTIFGGSLDKTIKPKFQILRDLGISAPDIASIITFDPNILCRSIDKRIVPSIMVLKDVLGSMSEVGELIRKPGCCFFLRYNLQKSLLPNIEILRSCGISRDKIIHVIFQRPRLVLYKPERLRALVERAYKLGCDRNSPMFMYAIETLGSMSSSNWELKWDLFRNMGITEDKLLWMFRRMPPAFAVSDRKIKEVVKVLLDTGKYDIDYISDEPCVFMCSVEKRLKLRLRVMEILESKDLLKQRPGLSTICKRTNEEFVKLFVSPYLDEDPEIKLLYDTVFAKVTKKFRNQRRC